MMRSYCSHFVLIFIVLTCCCDRKIDCKPFHAVSQREQHPNSEVLNDEEHEENMRENIETTHDHRPHLQHQHQQFQLKEEPESPNSGSFFLRDLMNEEIISLLQQIDRSPDSVLPSLGMKDNSKGRDDGEEEERDEDAVEDETGRTGSRNRVKSRNNRNWATFEQSLWHKVPQVHSSPSSSNTDVASDAAIASSSSLTKRGEGPQLSVVSPLDVLRQQLMYELARRRIKENRDQIRVNEQFLKNLGKRSADPTEADLMTQSHGDQQLNPQSLSDYLYHDYQPFVTENSSRTRSSRERDVKQEPQQQQQDSSSESSSSAVRFASEKEEEENDVLQQEEQKEGKGGKVVDEAAGGEAVESASGSPVDEEEASSLLLSQLQH